jgi:peptide chain release factor 2
MSEDPGFWTDNAKAQGLLREKAQLEQVVGSFDRTARERDDAQAMHELAEEARDEGTREEAAAAVDVVDKAIQGLEFQRMLSGPHGGDRRGEERRGRR